MPGVETILEINNLTDFAVDEKFLSEVADGTFVEYSKKCLFGKRITISVALVSKEEIAEINFGYRKKKKPTDVLSFSEYAKIQEMCHNKDKDIFLGEIILCPEFIEQSSAEQEVSFDFELAYIFSHGILHLLGFSHGKEMFSIQEKVAKKLST